jgi:hypothetical protein
MIGFNIDNLNRHILDKKSNFTRDEHYKIFNCNKIQSKELFLTFKGLIRVLLSSHSHNVQPFIKWATEKIFTLQFGTFEQKEELVGSILGVNVKAIKEVFNANRNTLPCIYLFTLNTVKELREIMNIDNKFPDDAVVAQFGFTNDLSIKIGEDITKYGNIPNVNLKLKHYCYIDPQYMSDAETDIKEFMDTLKINFNYENYNGLVIIPEELLKIIDKQYNLIGKNYMGHISELVTKIKELEKENDNQLLNHRLEIQTINHENEKLLLNHQIEILKINNELELLKQKHEEQLLKVTNDKKLKDIQDKF